MNTPPVFQDLVFVGGGHTHALVLRKWAMNPIPGVRVTLISPQPMTPYSGMLPGLIAGHYTFDETHIDLVRLSLWAGIRFIQDRVTAIDVDKKILSLAQRPAMAFDVVSIDIGSTPSQTIEGAAEHGIAVKPISQFYSAWQALEQQTGQQAKQQAEQQAIAQKIKSLAVVGGGAGGMEIMMAMAYRLQSLNPDPQDQPDYHLITRSADILPGYHAKVVQAVKKQLQKYRINVHPETQVNRLSQGQIHCQNHKRISADAVVLCTQAKGSAWLKASGLQCDAAGFVKVRQTLQTLDCDFVFAAGDIAHMVSHPRPKAGVYAVRQAPILFQNVRAMLLHKPLKTYIPQDGFLSLLALGEQKGTGSKSIFSFSGAWVWRWKDAIDRKFMNQFNALPPLSMDASTHQVNPHLMDPDERSNEHNPLKRCGGCGAKVGSNVLEQVVNALQGEGRYQPRDAVRITDQAALVYQSVDAIKAFIQDPFVLGQLAVSHALSDLYAMNLKPESAQVLITLPHAGQKIQARQLTLLMQGIFKQLDTLGCRFLGGHTSEAAELSVGLVVNGLPPKQAPLFGKDGLQPGDTLVMSKPLGTGVVMAASMRNQCDGRVFNAAIASMLQANDRASQMLSALEIRGCTDITGFGLLGHLYEMCEASRCAARLNLDALPVLPGAEALSQLNIKSSLYPQNQAALQSTPSMQWTAAIAKHPRFALLFDPQTSGGLLAGIPGERLEQLNSDFYQQFTVIGEVCAPEPGASPITFVSRSPLH